MFGIKGEFSESGSKEFEWGRWSRSARELRAQGATEVMTDQEAARRGYAIKAAKAYAQARAKASVKEASRC